VNDLLTFRFADGAEWLTIDPANPPFAVFLDTPGQPGSERPVACPDPPPTLERRGEAIFLRYELHDGPDRIDAEFRLEPTPRELLCELSLRHEGPGRLRRATFPYFPCPQVATFDELMFASSWGDDISEPGQTISAFCRSDGNRQTMGMDYISAGDDEVAYSYPSIMAMQFMLLHNPGRTLYLASYAADDSTKAFAARVLGKHELAMMIHHYPFASGATWTSPPCSLSVLPGGWHAAADLYASHMRSVLTPATVPEWMRENFHGWIEINMKQHGRAPAYSFADLPRLYRERVSPTGVNVLQVAGWANKAFDQNYPDYRPNPELGTPEELRAASEEIRALGGRLQLYTNFRLVDPDSDFYRAGGYQCLCLDERGEPLIENYGTPADFRVACPSCEAYADHLIGEVECMIRDYGARAMQTDQVSCNLCPFCFDERHPHSTPAANFLPGMEALLRRLREMHQRLDPEFYVWAEGCHERFGQYYDVHQGHGEDFSWAIGAPVPELFPYVYPDALVTGHAKTGFHGLCHSFVQGKPFDVSLRNLDDPAFAELLADAIAIRKAHPAHFLRGTFRDFVGVQCEAPLRAFVLEGDGPAGRMVNLWLPGASPQQISHGRLRLLDAPPASPEGIYPKDLQVRSEGDQLDCAWTGPVASILFDGS
jgi:uncharacterized protein DUF6259